MSLLPSPSLPLSWVTMQPLLKGPCPATIGAADPTGHAGRLPVATGTIWDDEAPESVFAALAGAAVPGAS